MADSILKIRSRPSAWLGMGNSPSVLPKKKKKQNRKSKSKIRRARTADLIFYSRMIINHSKKLTFYKNTFLNKYPNYTEEFFKNFVNMHYAVVHNKKLKRVGSSFEINALLNYFHESDQQKYRIRLFKQLCQYSENNHLSKKTKIICNRILKEYEEETYFTIDE